MRRRPRPRSAYLAGWALVPALLTGAWACDGRRPVGPGGIRDIAIILPDSTLRPGRRMSGIAVPLGPGGAIIELPVMWRSLTPELLTVTPEGELTAHSVGVATIQVEAGGIARRRELRLVNPPAARLRITDDTIRLSLPGDAVHVFAVALDSADEELVGARFAYSSAAARIAAVDQAGAVRPIAVGITHVTVAIDGVVAQRPVRVSPLPSPIAPEVTAVEPELIVPGTPFVLRGARFASTVAGNSVVVDGFNATVTAASGTELTAVLSAGAMPCLPTRSIAVQVATTSGVGAADARLQVAPLRTLAVGEALLLGSASASACNELAHGGGRYLVSVQHASRVAEGGVIALELDVRGGAGPTAVLSIASPFERADAPTSPHLALLERSVRAARAAGTTSVTRAMPAVQLPPINGIVQLNLPNFEGSNLCTTAATVGARTAFLGERVAILEDTSTMASGLPTLAGQMDELYAELASEFDAVLWPLAQRFGDPLVMDRRLDDNGRVVLLFTPRMNRVFGGGILAAVVTCDFFTRAQFQSSNVGEVIYAQVPTSTATGMDAGTRERWLYEMRGTILHELKHVTSFASRIVRGQPIEEPWLEEATARHAEELFARARIGFGATDDVGYSALACEVAVLSRSGECAGTPRTMLPHFEGLWDFLDAQGARSPLGPTLPGDVSFYGSSWSLVRWALDHASGDEGALVREFVSSGLSGVANLEARSGRGWDELLARWSLALMADGRTSAPPLARFASWDLDDVFGGLCRDLGSCEGLAQGTRFTRASALRRAIVNEANATVSITAIAPASFVAVELVPGTAGSRRLLHLRGATGPALPTTARLAILRIE